MKFTKVGLQQLLSEVVELPAEWLDDAGREVLMAIRASMERLSTEGAGASSGETVRECLGSIPRFLDVCRLVLGVSQDTLATNVSEELAARGKAR